jgi:hypothetical protein
MTRFDFTLEDVANVVGEQLKRERKRILEHMERRIALTEVKAKAAAGHGDVRDANYHRRLCELESEVRSLRRERGSGR